MPDHNYAQPQNSFVFTKNHKCVLIEPNELKMAPLKANDPSDPDANNGLITTIWGPPTWKCFHSITFGYPIKPTEEQKKDYLLYFQMLGKVLPCIYCRASYQKFISEGDTKLDMAVMQSRETLTKWGLKLHDTVNKKLGVDYGVTYEELCFEYNSYRAACSKNNDKKVSGCVTPLDLKALSYQKAEIHRAPIIDKQYSLLLRDHAINIGLKNYDKYFDYYSSLARNTPAWSGRDCSARKIIKYMRQKGISSLDKNGLPSFHEMMLICMLSSTLDKNKLNEIVTKLNK